MNYCIAIFRTRLSVVLSVALSILFMAGSSTSRAQGLEPWKGSAILDDPEWRAHFMGTYGFLSGVEMQPNATELEVLREVIEVMKVNPEAAAAMLQAQAGEQSSAALDFVLANLQFQNGQHDAAIANYERALGKFPDFLRAHKNLGLLFVQKGDQWAKAVTHLSRAVELGDRDGRTYGLLGFSHLTLENFLAAEQAYRSAVLAEPDVRDWKLGLARSLVAIENHTEAAAIFDMLIAEDSNDANAWLFQANAYVGLDQPEAAAVNLEVVRMLGKAKPSTLVLLGDIYMNSGQPELATSAYLEVLSSAPSKTTLDTGVRAASLLLRTRSYGEAGEVLAAIDRRYPKLSGARELEVLTLKAKLARAQGRKKEAARLLESVVDRDGTRGEALIELAAYHHGQGNLAKARFLIERAENLEAFEYRALLEHAQYEVAAESYGRAAELLRRALQINSEPRVERFLAVVEKAIHP